MFKFYASLVINKYKFLSKVKFFNFDCGVQHAEIIPELKSDLCSLLFIPGNVLYKKITGTFYDC